MGKITDKQADKVIRDTEDFLTSLNKKETKMKETITINKYQYKLMKYTLIALSLAAVVSVSVMLGRNWGYSDHQSEVNKITAQLKTKQ